MKNSDTPRMRRPKYGAFTMVELLVVIAILAVLAALAIPGVSRIRAQSDKARDISNLRQIGAAMNLYVAENNGYYPTMISGVGDGWSPPYWTDQLEPFLPRETHSLGPRSKVLYNPKFRDNHVIAGYGANSFVVNLHQQDPATGKPRAIASAMIDNKSRTFLVCNVFEQSTEYEGELTAKWFLNASSILGNPETKTLPRPYPVHPGNSFAALFCDGHAETIEFENFKENIEEFVGTRPWMR